MWYPQWNNTDYPMDFIDEGFHIREVHFVSHRGRSGANDIINILLHTFHDVRMVQQIDEDPFQSVCGSFGTSASEIPDAT